MAKKAIVDFVRGTTDHLTISLSPAILVAAEESPSPKAAAPNPLLDQKALDQLKLMSATLAAAKAFTFRTSSNVEVPAKT